MLEHVERYFICDFYVKNPVVFFSRVLCYHIGKAITEFTSRSVLLKR